MDVDTDSCMVRSFTCGGWCQVVCNRVLVYKSQKVYTYTRYQIPRIAEARLRLSPSYGYGMYVWAIIRMYVLLCRYTAVWSCQDRQGIDVHTINNTVLTFSAGLAYCNDGMQENTVQYARTSTAAILHTFLDLNIMHVWYSYQLTNVEYVSGQGDTWCIADVVVQVRCSGYVQYVCRIAHVAFVSCL